MIFYGVVMYVLKFLNVKYWWYVLYYVYILIKCLVMRYKLIKDWFKERNVCVWNEG